MQGVQQRGARSGGLVRGRAVLDRHIHHPLLPAQAKLTNERANVKVSMSCVCVLQWLQWYSGTMVVEDYHIIAYTYAMQQQQEKKRQ